MTCDRCGDPIRAKAWRRADESRVCAECLLDAASAVPEEPYGPDPVAERIHTVFHILGHVDGCWYCKRQVAA